MIIKIIVGIVGFIAGTVIGLIVITTGLAIYKRAVKK